jgi:hypothetical protein
MKITTAGFSALVDDLVAALDERKIPEAEKKEPLDLLGTMKKNIVELP